MNTNMENPISKGPQIRMKWIKLISNKLLFLFYLILAPLIIIFTIYRRLSIPTQEMLLKDLSMFQTLKYLILALIAYSIFYKTFLFSVNKEHNIFNIFFNYHQTQYFKALTSIDNKLKEILRKKFNLKKFYGKTFISFLKKRKFLTNNIYIISCIIPKFIIIVALSIDIFFFFKLYYFYWSLLILLYCLLVDYIFFSLKKEYYYACKEIEPLIEIRIKGLAVTFEESGDYLIVNMPPTTSIFVYIEDIVINKAQLSKYEINLSQYFFKKQKDPLNIDGKATLQNYQYFLNGIFDMHYIISKYDLQKSSLQKPFISIISFCYFIVWFSIVVFNIGSILPLLNLILCDNREPFSEMPL